MISIGGVCMACCMMRTCEHHPHYYHPSFDMDSFPFRFRSPSLTLILSLFPPFPPSPPPPLPHFWCSGCIWRLDMPEGAMEKPAGKMAAQLEAAEEKVEAAEEKLEGAEEAAGEAGAEGEGEAAATATAEGEEAVPVTVEEAKEELVEAVKEEAAAVTTQVLTAKAPSNLQTFHAGGISAMDASHKDHFCATGGVDGSVRCWDYVAKQQLFSEKWEGSAVQVCHPPPPLPPLFPPPSLPPSLPPHTSLAQLRRLNF